MHPIFLFILLQSIPYVKNQSTPYPHFFLYDLGNKASDQRYEYGDFSMASDKIVKANLTTEKDAWLHKIDTSLATLHPGKAGIIIYIHGFQGDNKYFVQSSGYLLQKDIFDNAAHAYGMTVSLQWKSSIIYQDAVQTALQKGQNMAAVVDEIYRKQQKLYPGAPISIICHSMGNRVWQGLYDSWLEKNKSIRIENVFFFAADLECDIFDTAFENIQDHVAQSYVFYNRADRTLQMANALKEHKRLGIYGTSVQTDLVSKHITLIDATDIKDEETFAGKLSLHRYYYGSPTMREKTVTILSGKVN